MHGTATVKREGRYTIHIDGEQCALIHSTDTACRGGIVWCSSFPAGMSVLAVHSLSIYHCYLNSLLCRSCIISHLCNDDQCQHCWRGPICDAEDTCLQSASFGLNSTAAPQQRECSALVVVGVNQTRPLWTGKH